LRRRRLLASAPAALLLPRPALAQSADARVLRFVPRSDLTIVDPVVTTDYATRNHGLMIWDQLYGLDDQLRPQPQMAAGHVVEDDGKTWIFTLRDGLLFHDGTPVRGRDCIASIRRWAQRDALGQALLARTDEMSAPDDGRFVIRLKRPFGAMLDTLAKLGPPALLIMPERLAATSPARQITEITGSGPFRWKADERIVGARAVYERNPSYRPREGGAVSWAAGPKIVHFDRVEWTVMPDSGTASAALVNGEVDWWENPPNDLLPLLTRSRDVVTRLGSPLGDMATGIFNQLYPPFNKALVRRVVLHALSQRDLMMAAAGTDPALWRTGVGIFTPGAAMASTTGLEALADPPDIATSRLALLDAGYKGETVVLMAPSDKPVLAALGDVLHDLLVRLGMKVEYVVADWGTIVQRRASKAAPDKGGWSMFSTTWSGLDMINPAVTQVLRTDGAAGFFGWADLPEITALREAWLDAPDVAAQQRICTDLQTVALQDVPFLPMGQFFSKTANRRSVTGIVEGQFVFWNCQRG
jgi:peptide/nickel transport system substrate-binding protein